MIYVLLCVRRVIPPHARMRGTPPLNLGGANSFVRRGGRLFCSVSELRYYVSVSHHDKKTVPFARKHVCKLEVGELGCAAS